jgi:hypothetical protein
MGENLWSGGVYPNLCLLMVKSGDYSTLLAHDHVVHGRRIIQIYP